MWEELGNDPAKAPQTNEEIRMWRMRGLHGEARYEVSDIMIDRR